MRSICELQVERLKNPLPLTSATLAKTGLELALEMVRNAGYRVAYKPRKESGIATVNPHNHPFPHAKLRNVTLTSINRLSKFSTDAAWREYTKHMTR